MIDFLVSSGTFFFVLFALLPALCLMFVVTQFVQSAWFGILSTLHPEVEFIKKQTVRSLLDTHRNQGIGAVLLCVAGPAQPDAVRRHLQELVNRRRKNGVLAFPRLREALVTVCGTYAWKKVQFDLEKNVTVVPPVFKKRPITEHNIQDYVSDLVSKYLPQNSSPWHFIIIPTLENHHYLLLKLHHILLNEDLNIGDLLPLIPPTRYNSGSFGHESPLVDVFEKPKSLPLLKEKLTVELANYWNEFLSNHDPLENIELLKKKPSFLQFLAIYCITLVTILKEIRRDFCMLKTDIFSRLTFISYTFEKEMRRRQVNSSSFFDSIIVSLSPKNLLSTWFRIFWFLFTAIPIKIPSLIAIEFIALIQCITLRYSSYPNTFICAVFTYVPLVYGALKECFEIGKIIILAPKNIMSSILCQKEHLQTITLCGRKCVAWSEPIRKENLKRLSKSLNTSEFEILLAGFSKSLSQYLDQTDNRIIPDEIGISLRNINSNYIFATGVTVRPQDSCSGIIFTNLPILNERRGQRILDNLKRIKKNVRESVAKQQIFYILTILQTKFGVLTKVMPYTLLAIYLRYLSRKFAVAVTEVSSRYPNVHQRTLWGREVKSVIYCRPPQANTSISVCLNEYADHVKLAVMCDAQLVPNHTFLARNFVRHIEEIDDVNSY